MILVITQLCVYIWVHVQCTQLSCHLFFIAAWEKWVLTVSVTVGFCLQWLSATLSLINIKISANVPGDNKQNLVDLGKNWKTWGWKIRTQSLALLFNRNGSSVSQWCQARTPSTSSPHPGCVQGKNTEILRDLLLRIQLAKERMGESVQREGERSKWP